METSRTPFVIGAIGAAFALHVIMRGDLQRWTRILFG